MPVEPGLGAPVDATRAPGARPPTPAQVAATPRPVVAQPEPGRRERRPRRRGRRVRRVVRRVELWSVLKISIVFNTVMFGIALGAVAVLWGLATTTGLVEDLEGFLRDSGFEDFRFEGDVMFRQVAFIGAVMTLAVTVLTVLAAALFNLISEVTGGVRFVVIEEIVDRPETHPATAAPAPPVPAPPRAPRPARPSPRSGSRPTCPVRPAPPGARRTVTVRARAATGRRPAGAPPPPPGPTVPPPRRLPDPVPSGVAGSRAEVRIDGVAGTLCRVAIAEGSRIGSSDPGL